MDLTEPLKELVDNVPGAIGAILVDAEGESISLFSAARSEMISGDESLRLRLIGALQRIWLTQCRRIAGEAELGKLGYQVQSFSESKVVGIPVKDDYALFLIGDHTLYASMSLKYMAQTVSRLEQEI